MAVLVEAKTLIVRRRFLRAHYPGSTRQFLRDARHTGNKIRYAIADRHLAAVSSSDPGHLVRLTGRLEELGATDADRVRMDQWKGPESPVPWLSWHTDEQGVTGARLEPDGSLELTTPKDWAPDDSLEALGEEVLRTPDRFVPLGDSNAIGYWLDLETGREVRGIVMEKFETTDVFAKDLRLIAVRELRRRGLVFEGESGWGPISLVFTDDQARDFPMWILTEFRPYCLHVVLGLPGPVPPARRLAVADYLSRANWGLRCGQLAMDWSDGEVRFHASVLAADATLTPAMVGELIDAALSSAHMFVSGLERVIAGADAEQAYTEVETR